MMKGVVLDLGPSARLRCDGVDVIVTSQPFQTLDREIFLLHGIDVTRCSVVGLKSSQHFRAGFRQVAGAILTVDAPGLTTNRVEVFEHPAPVGRSGPASFASRRPVVLARSGAGFGPGADRRCRVLRRRCGRARLADEQGGASSANAGAIWMP